MTAAFPRHPQRLHTPIHCAFSLCTMIDANTIFNGVVGASILAACFHFAPMTSAYSPLLSDMCTIWILTNLAHVLRGRHHVQGRRGRQRKQNRSQQPKATIGASTLFGPKIACVGIHSTIPLEFWHNFTNANVRSSWT